jgi:hypothetical protein
MDQAVGSNPRGREKMGSEGEPLAVRIYLELQSHQEQAEVPQKGGGNASAMKAKDHKK